MKFKKIFEQEKVNKFSLVKPKKKTITHIVRENLDFLEEKVFPFWETLGYSKTKELSLLLKKNGYDVKQSSLSTIINNVRKEKKQKSKNLIAPSSQSTNMNFGWGN